MSQRGKTPRGEVAIAEHRGWLHLRWRYQGKRYRFSTGLQAGSPINQAIAEGAANRIRLDILAGQFDKTLDRYRVDQTGDGGGDGPTTPELFEAFITHKSQQVEQRTLEKYRGLVRHLDKWLPKRAKLVTEVDAYKFRDQLLADLAPVTVKERMSMMRECWAWAQKQGFVNDAPWTDVRVKMPPKKRPKPFTADEQKRIIAAFRENRYYKGYADFVEWLFLTGCRIGEAAGLRWGAVSEDCTMVWIGESYGRGRSKATKTNTARQFLLNGRQKELLLRIRPEEPGERDLVFTAPKGGPIDDHNFRNRAWTKVLASIDVEYRKPYNTRHTFVSHAIAAGVTIADLSQLTGHSERMIYEHYLGSVSGSPKMPEFED